MAKALRFLTIKLYTLNDILTCPLEALSIRTANNHLVCRPSQIICCKASSNYTRLYFTNSKPLLVSKTLKQYEAILLAHNFIRIHQSYLINKAHIQQVSTGGIITLTNGSVLAISKRRKIIVKKELQAFKPAC
jgi:two-component system, LytTR family, response regulator